MGQRHLRAVRQRLAYRYLQQPVRLLRRPKWTALFLNRFFFFAFPLDEYRSEHHYTTKYEYANLQGQGSSGSTSGELCSVSTGPTRRETMQGSRDRSSWLIIFNGVLLRRRKELRVILRYGLSGPVSLWSPRHAYEFGQSDPSLSRAFGCSAFVALAPHFKYIRLNTWTCVGAAAAPNKDASRCTEAWRRAMSSTPMGQG